jgi:hypothetical protein
MNINDYLIDQTGKDWTRILRPWMPPLPANFTLWLVNRFGDLFVVDDDGGGSVSMLDVGTGGFHKVADSRDHFAQLIDQGDNANNWLLLPLVDRCRAAGIVLTANQCYTFKLPPMLGGKYVLSNVAPIDIDVHYAFAAEMYQQAKDAPIGASVRSVVFER